MSRLSHETRRQLRDEMRRYGINAVSGPRRLAVEPLPTSPMPDAWARLFTDAVEAFSPARTLAFVPVPIARVRGGRRTA